MGLRHKVSGALLAFFGLLFFAFGLYILPFGTDAYMYFWVELVFHGNWLYGDIAANAAALLMILAGLVMLRKAGKEPKLKDALPVEKKKSRKKKSSKKKKKSSKKKKKSSKKKKGEDK